MSERVVWWQRPQLRTDEDEHRHRKVSWMELFFDLVFVVVVAELSHGLAEHLDRVGVLQFVLLFVPVWWVWIGMTIYAERFETEDISHRVFHFAMMLPVGAMAVFAHGALHGTAVQFALSYVVARSLIILMWFRGGWYDRRAKPMTDRYALGFSISVALWLASIFFEPHVRFVMWGLGLFIDLVTPMFTLKHQTTMPRFSTSKLPERFGLFTIIVLGESIVGTVGGLAAQHHVGWGNFGTFVFGMALAFGVWWLYFDLVSRRTARRGIWFALARSYTHLPLVIAITATGAGVLRVVGHEGEALGTAERWLLCIGVGGTLLCLAALVAILDHKDSDVREIRRLHRVIALMGLLALAVGVVGHGWSAISVLAVMVGLVALPIVYGAIRWVQGRLT